MTTHGVSARAVRNPRLPCRFRAVFLLRSAERRFLGSSYQEPPRATRYEQPPLVSTRSELDPWGQDAGQGWDSPPAAPAAANTDVWGDETGEREHTRPGVASVANSNPWGQATGQGRANAAATPIAGDVGDAPIDAEWQNEYTAALNHFLGLDDDSSYEAALIEVERLELEALRRQEERERQARLAAEERERQARLAKRRRIEAQERERQAELERQRRIESASRERRRQTLQNIQRSAASITAVVENAAAAVRNAQSGSGRRGNSPNESRCVSIPNVKWCGSH